MQRQRRRQRDAGDTASAMWVRMPVQRQQRHQRCIGWSIGDQVSWEQSRVQQRCHRRQQGTTRTQRTLMCCDFNLYLADAERATMMPCTDSHCGQWAARSDNEGMSVALIMSGSAAQGQASTALDMETMPGTRQRQKDKCHQHRLHVGQGPDQ
jgi:hypothetical protein